MDRRPLLQAKLEEILGSQYVYFQPPASLVMKYPCIVFKRDNASTEFADNLGYRFTQRYQVTLINREPSVDIVERIALLPMCIYNRYYPANNLNHDVFILYF